jgi:DHA3 family tetracycline resistance protein-like MFS transporter
MTKNARRQPSLSFDTLLQRRAYRVYLAIKLLSAILLFAAFAVDSLYFVVDAHLDPLQLVLVGTTLEVTIFLFEVPTGVVADTVSRRLSVIIGMALIGLGWLVQGLLPVFWAILLSQVVWGLGVTFNSGALEAWIADEIGPDRSDQTFLRGAQFHQAGAILGIIMGTALGAIFTALPLVVSGLLFLVLAGGLAAFMPEHGFKPAQNGERVTWKTMAGTLRSGLKLVRGHPVLIAIFLISLFYGLYSEGFDRLWVAHMLERFTFPLFKPVVWFGILQGAAMLLAAGVIEWVKRRLDTGKVHQLLRTLLLTSGLLVLSLAGFAVVRSLWSSIGLFILITILRETNYPLFTAWTNRHLESQTRATVLSMTSLVDAVGQIGGGPWVGWIARQVSMQAALLTSAGLLSPVLAILGRRLKLEDGKASGQPALAEKG